MFGAREQDGIEDAAAAVHVDKKGCHVRQGRTNKQKIKTQ
jgi:hypothetical protein